MATSAQERIERVLDHPPADLLAELRAAEWTAHGIQLTRTLSTRPDEPPVSACPRTALLLGTLERLFFAGRSLAGLRALDIGCLEGGLSLELARRDMTVVGVEGRAANVRKCQLLQRYFDLPALSFLHLDAKALDPAAHGTFDVLVCCGLLYHLDAPVAFLERLASLLAPGGVLFLDTHVAPEHPADLEACVHPLSDLVDVAHRDERYRGRWYEEWPGGERAPWSAVSNPRSLWLTAPSLQRALYRAGFSRTYRARGMMDPADEQPWLRRESRVHLFAVGERFFE